MGATKSFFKPPEGYTLISRRLWKSHMNLLRGFRTAVEHYNKF
jgi:hypothetical protein